jgi:L-gulonate 3-dehydrogenase
MVGPSLLSGSKLAEVEAQLRAQHPLKELPERQRWRDKRLAALVAHKRAAALTIGD